MFLFFEICWRAFGTPSKCCQHQGANNKNCCQHPGANNNCCCQDPGANNIFGGPNPSLQFKTFLYQRVHFLPTHFLRCFGIKNVLVENAPSGTFFSKLKQGFWSPQNVVSTRVLTTTIVVSTLVLTTFSSAPTRATTRSVIFVLVCAVNSLSLVAQRLSTWEQAMFVVVLCCPAAPKYRGTHYVFKMFVVPRRLNTGEHIMFSRFWLSRDA